MAEIGCGYFLAHLNANGAIGVSGSSRCGWSGAGNWATVFWAGDIEAVRVGSVFSRGSGWADEPWSKIASVLATDRLCAAPSKLANGKAAIRPRPWETSWRFRPARSMTVELDVAAQDRSCGTHFWLAVAYSPLLLPPGARVWRTRLVRARSPCIARCRLRPRRGNRLSSLASRLLLPASIARASASRLSFGAN
jgi:hypothetical protein